jgi:hypothetical protein
MIGFLKSFFSNEKSADEQALIAAQAKPRDVMVIDAYAMDETEEEDSGGCSPRGGCGSCGCG